jgi:hypothetical protein
LAVARENNTIAPAMARGGECGIVPSDMAKGLDCAALPRRMMAAACAGICSIGRITMTAYNVVRNRVKPGREKDFEEAIRNIDRDYAGMRRFTAIKTGDRDYCMIGEWDNMDAIVAARPQMIKSLDTFRDMLEDLGGGLGVTDPVSGEAVVELVSGK